MRQSSYDLGPLAVRLTAPQAMFEAQAVGIDQHNGSVPRVPGRAAQARTGSQLQRHAYLARMSEHHPNPQALLALTPFGRSAGHARLKSHVPRDCGSYKIAHAKATCRDADAVQAPRPFTRLLDPQAQRQMGYRGQFSFLYAEAVRRPYSAPSLCLVCGLCLGVSPVLVIQVRHGAPLVHGAA